jgi:hypothetical protein
MMKTRKKCSRDIQSDRTTRMLPGPAVDLRYGICSRTRARWKKTLELNFPQPAMTINAREYYDEDHLIEWERVQAAKSTRLPRKR